MALRVFTSFSLLLTLVTTPALGIGVCDRLVRSLKDRRDLQPSILKLANGSRVFFHNHRLREIFDRGFSLETVSRAETLLQQNGALDIKITEEGYVVAADSRGSYSTAIWARDSARVASSLEGAERTKVVSRLLDVMANPLNRELFFLNIRNPDVHQMSDAVLQEHISKNWSPLFEGMDVTSSMFVPHIRFLISQLKDPNVKPERWNMKQNDALALVFIEGIRALNEGAIIWEDLTPSQKSFFTLNITYALRTQFWESWDAGAWEEANGRRTSSVGLMTEALYQFQKSPFRKKIVDSIRESDFLPSDIKNLVEAALEKDSVDTGIAHGKRIVFLQLGRGEVPDRFEDHARQAKRFSDAALAHLLWYRPESFQESDYRLVLGHLDRLRRASGIIRYGEDVYLTIGQGVSAADIIPAELIRDREKRGVITAGQIQDAFWKKDAAFIESVYGVNYEAQWVLTDMMLVQILPHLIERFSESPHKAEYEAMLEEAALRMFGFVTGGERAGDGPFAIDGLQVEPWRFPEAWIPARLYGEDGTNETVWTLSKFTPLNWATAEARLALKSLREYLARKGQLRHENR